MDFKVKWLVISLLCYFECVSTSNILCERGFCNNFMFDPGCSVTSRNCAINNATHMGITMLSPTICNCCDFCMPLFGREAHCSRGGPGLGTTVGRCGHGLTCVADTDGFSYCRRLQSECHSAQDDFDKRHELGQTGALEARPECDSKGRYGVKYCMPTQTCHCQSEDGERIFGESLNIGASTMTRMQCGCSRLHDKVRKQIGSGVPYPVIGPRCTQDGNFNTVQCIGTMCHCVNRLTGAVVGNETINLADRPISNLTCYDSTVDLFPSQSTGRSPFRFTTPCLERIQLMKEFLQESEENGYNVDFNSTVSGCLPDGTFGRIWTDNGTKICINETGIRIGKYEAQPNTDQYENMDCKCAVTAQIMALSPERPICCSNGNYRTIQCRRGLCRCVDSDGKQYGQESSDVITLSCYKSNWRDPDSIECYSK